MSNRNTVAITYGSAAWLVVFGVVVSWLFLKQDASGSMLELPPLPDMTNVIETDTSQATLLAQADAAFAAGRITRPIGGSALDLYRAHLQSHPDDAEAIDGLARVTRYLLGTAESALRQSDWTTARDLAQQALAIDGQSRAGKSILKRVQQHDEIARLNEQALAQIEQNNLTKPQGNNALASYRAILKLEPDNTIAKQGLQMIAQRLAGLAQAAAIADRTSEAKQLIATAKEIAPEAQGIEAAEKLAQEWQELATDQAIKDDLTAATDASEAGRLIAADEPGKLGALDFYRAALKKDPGSEAAQAGVGYVISALIERARMQVISEQLENADASLRHALEAGATEAELRPIAADLAFLQRRERNRAGQFSVEDMKPLSALSVRRSVQPVLPNDNQGGVVDLEFTVTEEGDVDDVKILDSDNAALQEAAISALSKWRFDPYEEEGRALPVRTQIRMRIET